uniref:DBF4-type domain-containing protein n=1 Tax=Steinernema glaseri TaxID=37863 RepID=A0A1I7Y7E8_9BILA
MEPGGASTSLSIGNRRSSAPGKRNLPSSLKTGTAGKKPRLSNQSDTTSRTSHGRQKPWGGKRFQIDVDNITTRESIVKDIVKMGGAIIDEFSDSTKPIHFLISDSPYAVLLEQKKIITNDMRTKMGGILRSAVDSKIPVKSATSFLLQVVDFKKKHAHLTSPRISKDRTKEKPHVRKLVAPYLKVQDLDHRYAPLYREFVTPVLNKIYVGSRVGKSVFHMVTSDELEKRAVKRHRKAVPRAEHRKGDCEICNRHRKAVPRAEYRKGDCEICNVTCQNLLEHYRTRDHIKRIRAPDFYCEVDALCGSFIDEIKVTGCRTLVPRQPSPVPEPPSPSSDCDEFIARHYGSTVE